MLFCYCFRFTCKLLKLTIYICLDSGVESPPKKLKAVAYKITPELKKLIKNDEVNGKVWQEGLEYAAQGQQVSSVVSYYY